MFQIGMIVMYGAELCKITDEKDRKKRRATFGFRLGKTRQSSSRML